MRKCETLDRRCRAAGRGLLFGLVFVFMVGCQGRVGNSWTGFEATQSLADQEDCVLANLVASARAQVDKQLEKTAQAAIADYPVRISLMCINVKGGVDEGRLERESTLLPDVGVLWVGLADNGTCLAGNFHPQATDPMGHRFALDHADADRWYVMRSQAVEPGRREHVSVLTDGRGGVAPPNDSFDGAVIYCLEVWMGESRTVSIMINPSVFWLAGTEEGTTEDTKLQAISDICSFVWKQIGCL